MPTCTGCQTTNPGDFEDPDTDSECVRCTEARDDVQDDADDADEDFSEDIGDLDYDPDED